MDTIRPTHTITLQAVTSKLLVLSSGEEIAKRIESHLRNAGRPVRCAWVTDLEDLEDAIRRGSPDLVLCQENQARAPVKDVLALCNRLMPDQAKVRDFATLAKGAVKLLSRTERLRFCRSYGETGREFLKRVEAYRKRHYP